MGQVCLLLTFTPRPFCRVARVHRSHVHECSAGWIAQAKPHEPLQRDPTFLGLPRPFSNGADFPNPMKIILLLCAIVVAAAIAEEPKSVLGQLVHARGSVHTMNRAELEAELDERNAPHLITDTEDELRMRLYHARGALLQHRTSHVMHAESILAEVNQCSDERALAGMSLDSVLADDNAIFMNAMGNRMLEGLKTQAGLGAIVGLVLAYFAPLGRLRRPPNALASPLAQTAAMCAAGGAVLGVLQLALRHVRRMAGAPSYFCQKLAFVTCRDATVSWLLERDEQQQQQQRATSTWLASSSSVPLVVPLWQRRGVLVPVAILATGSSVFEEVVFRGILLHALVAKARWPAGLAAVLTSALFGWMHLKNDEGHPHGAIYAGWTFLGGLVFSASYLGTQGGLIAPIALHFGLNAIIFGDSVLRVGAKLWEDRQGFLAVSSRFEQSRAARRVADTAVPTAAAPTAAPEPRNTASHGGRHGGLAQPAAQSPTSSAATPSGTDPNGNGQPLSRLGLSRLTTPPPSG